MNNSPAQLARKFGLIAALGIHASENSAASFGALRVSGPDAATFLHSQLTNEVNALKPGEGNLTARVTRTGTLVRYGSLHRLPDGQSFLILLEREGVRGLIADLEKFAVVEDVSLADVSDEFDWIAIQGPEALQAAEEAFGSARAVNSENAEPLRTVPDNSAREFVSGPCAGTLLFIRSLAGDAGCIVAVPREAELSGEIIERVRGCEHGKSLVHLQGAELHETLDTLRVEAGVVRIGVDVGQGEVVLPEAGLEQQVVSYSKGCYLGQEVIARIRTYGSVPLVLRGLVLERESAAGVPPLRADAMLEDGTKVGRFASRAFSPMLNAFVAFAFLDRSHRTPGTKLKLRGADGSILNAEVRLLPFYRAADTASRVAFLHDRAIRLFAAGNDEQAQALLEEALRIDPSFSEGYETLGVLLGRRGKFTEAIDIFKRLEEVAPDEPMVHTNLSLFYMKIGDKVAAEEEKAKGVIKQFGKFAGAKKAEQFAAEEAAKKRADAERKRAMFEEVLDIDAEDPIALFGLGNALSALEDWEGAERVLAKSCAVQSDNSAAYLARGRALEMLSREADAVEVYRTGMAVASKKGDLMPLKEMERRVLLLAK